MIGQRNLIAKIKKLIENNSFPKFCIITGPAGSGKKTVLQWLEKYLGNKVFFRMSGISVDDVRTCIKESYRLSGVPNFICFPDADTMSPQAKNALLKITEEPPENCYFIMTLEDVSNTLATIKSRSTVFTMDSYLSSELQQYLFNLDKSCTDLDFQRVADLCENPGEVNILYNSNIQEFYSYVELVVDNIAEVSGANSFKIPAKVSLKADSEGYDLKLFFKAFMLICLKKMSENPVKYATGVSITSKHLQQLGIKGVSKQMTMDHWILEIRKAWCK